MAPGPTVFFCLGESWDLIWETLRGRQRAMRQSFKTCISDESQGKRDRPAGILHWLGGWVGKLGAGGGVSVCYSSPFMVGSGKELRSPLGLQPSSTSPGFFLSTVGSVDRD